MKKTRLNLKALQVKSFVTDMNHSNSKTVKGGTSAPAPETALNLCTVGDPCSHITCYTHHPCLTTSTVSTHNPE